LDLDRDCDRINAEYDFKRAGIHALGAGAYGTMATVAALSGSPYAALGTAIGAALAGVSVWKGMQDIGKGVQDSAKGAAADTTLRILHQHQPEQPGTLVWEAEPYDQVTQPPIQIPVRT
jgi:hypothetical protein